MVQQAAPGAFVEAKKSAMDFGAQMTSRGPPVLGRFKTRLERARLKLIRLRSMKLPLPTRSTLLKGGVYPLAFYGLAVLPLGVTHFDQLRPLCADGLLGKSASRNRAIALIAAPHALDPQFYCSRAPIRHMQFDMFATRKVIAELPPSHQPSVVLEIAGAFQTEVQKRKWASDTPGTCVHCGELDSRHHRLFTCAATADLREPYARALQALQEDGSLIHEMPICAADPTVELLSLVHSRHPEAMILEPTCQRLQALQQEGVRLTFYTDGSLQFPADPAARFAAYARVFDLCRDDSQRAQAVEQWRQTGIEPITFATLAVANTTGDQRIYRSELFALVVICEHFDAATIYTDCQSVLNTALKCQVAASLLPFLGQEDFDLVARLWSRVRRGDYLFLKVAAYVDVTPSMSLWEVYQVWGNPCANAAANSTCWNAMPDMVEQCVQLHALREKELAILRQVYALHLDLHKARAQLEANNEQLQQHQQMFRATGPAPFEVLRNWTIATEWSPPTGRVHMIGDSAWGLELNKSLRDWMELVRWPTSPADDDPGITFYELALSYMLHTGYVPPIKRADAKGCEFLQPIDSFACFEAYGISFSEVSMTFSIWMTQVRKLHAYMIWLEFEHGTTRSLYRLGATFQSRGIKVRPVIPCQEQVGSMLATYIRRRPECTDVPEFPVVPIPPGMKRHFATPWNKLQRKGTLAVKRVKELQRTTSSLTFGTPTWVWWCRRFDAFFLPHLVHRLTPWLHQPGQGSLATGKGMIICSWA